MLTKDQKIKALNTSIDVAKAYGACGEFKIEPALIIKNTYDTILEIIDEIEQ